VSSSGGLNFSIKQRGNLAVMKAIQNFFNELLISNTPIIASNSNLRNKGTQALNDSSYSSTSFCLLVIKLATLTWLFPNPPDPFRFKAEVEVNFLTISRGGFIKIVLIPLFNSLAWHTKKEMDYIDWKTIFKIKNLGLDYEKGLEIIKLIASKMNNNRLSTAGLESVDRTWLVSEVDKLLERETPVCNLSLAESENILETESTLDVSKKKDFEAIQPY
jgi:hypothetical protein